MKTKNGLITFSEKAVLAIHAMVYLQELGEDSITDSGTMATDLGVSPTHLAKVLSILANKRLVNSLRGRGGGIMMAETGDKLSILDILKAVEEPVGGPYCPLGNPVHKSNQCVLVGVMDQINHITRKALSKVTIEQFRPCPYVIPGKKRG